MDDNNPLYWYFEHGCNTVQDVYTCWQNKQIYQRSVHLENTIDIKPLLCNKLLNKRERKDIEAQYDTLSAHDVSCHLDNLDEPLCKRSKSSILK